MNVDDAKTLVLARRDDPKGIVCPCCGQLAKRYKRPLNAQIALFLIHLTARYKATGQWVDIKTLPLRGGDYAKSVYWDLAEAKPNTNPKTRSSGFWRPTIKGLQFVNRGIRCPKYALVYDGVCEGLHGKQISIEEALGKKFDYQKLMRAVGI